MSGIFYLSHQTSSQSRAISSVVAEKVYENVDLTPERFEYKNDTWLLAHYEHLIRKAAHLLLYIVLGVLLAIACAGYFKKKRNIFLISSAIGIFYAVTDEVHQYFIPGRSFLAEDIFIDSIGVTIGSLFVIFMLWSIICFRKRRNKQDQVNFLPD